MAKRGWRQVDGRSERSVVAVWVIILSGLVLAGISAVMITTAKDAGSAADRAFSMLVPMIGTWIGTVIAYYFSGENFERASQSVSKLVDQVIVEKLKGIPATEAMIPRAQMVVRQLAAGDDGSAVDLKTGVLDLFKSPVTRLPVLSDQGHVKYIIHQSVVFKYVTEKTIEMSGQGKPFDLSGQTLKTFLDHPGNRDLVSGTLAFVAQAATLADAKARMEAVAGCQDVFVTTDGSADRPVLGWLPNVEVMKRARA